jgi:hypothetical protein
VYGARNGIGAGTHDTLVLIQHLVVFAQTDEEHERRHVLEAVDPLLTLGPLATDVEELVCEFADLDRKTRVSNMSVRTE